MSGLGSVFGLLVGSSLMVRFDIDGVLYFMAAAALVLGLVAGTASLMVKAPAHLERPFEILAPQAARLAHDPPGVSD